MFSKDFLSWNSPTYSFKIDAWRCYNVTYTLVAVLRPTLFVFGLLSPCNTSSKALKSRLIEWTSRYKYGDAHMKKLLLKCLPRRRHKQCLPLFLRSQQQTEAWLSQRLLGENQCIYWASFQSLDEELPTGEWLSLHNRTLRKALPRREEGFLRDSCVEPLPQSSPVYILQPLP